jgi:hypothetical protein
VRSDPVGVDRGDLRPIRTGGRGGRAVARLLLAAAAAACLSACAGGGRSGYIDLDEDTGGVGIEAQDIRAVSDRMARSLVDALGAVLSDGEPATVVFDEVINRSSQIFDKRIFLERMRAELNRSSEGRLVFLARENLPAILAEREAKRRGEVTSGTEKELLGADYVLTGTVTGLAKAEGRKSMDRYWFLSFRMVDAEDSSIVWEDAYEFRKRGESSFIYR